MQELSTPGLAVLLRKLERDRTSGWLRIGHLGRIGLVEGQIVCAEAGSRRGEEAFCELYLVEDDTSFYLSTDTPEEYGPMGNSMGLTMRGLRIREEWARLRDLVLRRSASDVEVELSEAQQALLEHMDGRQTVAQVVRRAGLLRSEAVDPLVSLLEYQAVEVVVEADIILAPRVEEPEPEEEAPSPSPSLRSLMTALGLAFVTAFVLGLAGVSLLYCRVQPPADEVSPAEVQEEDVVAVAEEPRALPPVVPTALEEESLVEELPEEELEETDEPEEVEEPSAPEPTPVAPTLPAPRREPVRTRPPEPEPEPEAAPSEPEPQNFKLNDLKDPFTD